MIAQIPYKLKDRTILLLTRETIDMIPWGTKMYRLDGTTVRRLPAIGQVTITPQHNGVYELGISPSDWDTYIR